MKAILEFNLPDDQHDFDMAIEGYKWSLVAWDIDQYLRTRMKYEDTISDDEYKAVEAAREKLRNIISNYSLDIDK